MSRMIDHIYGYFVVCVINNPNTFGIKINNK